MSVLCLNGCSDVDSGVGLVHSPCNCLSVLFLCGFQLCCLSTSTEPLSLSVAFVWFTAVFSL